MSPHSQLKLGEYLGYYYALQWATDDSVHFAWPGHRIRQFIALNHRDKTVGRADIAPLYVWFRQFYRSRASTCTHEVFVDVTDDEIQEMFDDMSKKKTAMRGTTFNVDTFDWVTVLAPGHQKALKNYRKVSPGQAFSLGQDVTTGFGASSSNGTLQTIIRNCRRLWIDWKSNPRPATGTELLYTQGVALPQTMRHKPCGDQKCSPFDIVNPDRTECSRSAQAGNGMNIQIAALLTQYLLLSFHLKGTPEFL